MAAVSFMFLLLSGGYGFFVSGHVCDRFEENCKELTTSQLRHCHHENWDACIDASKKCINDGKQLLEFKKRLASRKTMKEVYCSNPKYIKDESLNPKCWLRVSSCLFGVFSVLPDETVARTSNSVECQNAENTLGVCIQARENCKSTEIMPFINEIQKYTCCGKEKIENCNRCGAPACAVKPSITPLKDEAATTSSKAAFDLLIVIVISLLLLN